MNHVTGRPGAAACLRVDLSSPFELHGTTLPNRVVMAPMTRTRATEHGVPTALMRDYYVQRAAAGLIITECTAICAGARGIVRGPGIHTEAQIARWRDVTDAVHAAGGRIVSQIWHPGRAAHPGLAGEGPPVGPSPIAASGKAFLPPGCAAFEVPRALDIDELPGIVADFARAARNARDAGFDGVEIHAGDGYLLQQFLEDGSNRRPDAYGGSAGNRARLALEVVDAVIEAWDAARVGVRLSPAGEHCGDDSVQRPATYDHLVRALAERGVGHLHLVGANRASFGAGPIQIKDVPGFARARYAGPIIVNGGYDRRGADAALARGHADLVAFGVPFIANPDLVARLATGAACNVPDRATFYGSGPEGYTDYPVLRAVREPVREPASERSREPETA